MKIYFSCSITGGRQDQPIYAALVRHLQGGGHTVLTAHMAGPGVFEEDGDLDPVTIYDRDTRWVRECDMLIAEVSTPSHGVGYEVAYALGRGKPVLCCHRDGVRVSKMITGNREPGLALAGYRDEGELLARVDGFLGA